MAWYEFCFAASRLRQSRWSLSLWRWLSKRRTFPLKRLEMLWNLGDITEKNTEVSTKMGTWIFLGRYKTSKEFWFYASGLAHDHSMGWLDVWIICCLKMCSKKVRSRLELLDSWMTVDLRATHQFYVMSLNTLHQNIWTHHRLGYVCEFQLLTPTFCLMLG